MASTNPRHDIPSIQLLPRDIAEKIAAGEVIERPFSVVKELVENSVDAKARMVQVRLEDGGHRTIEVTDDGHGIPSEQMPLALERHATSKIKELDDLWNLYTMGFRGEAIPSIAAISHFTLESRTIGATGRSLIYEGGKLREDKVLPANAPVPMPSGTRVLVEHLFYNVPARLKFLKSKASESAAVRDLLERLALCWPSVSFTLVSEGRKTLVLPATTTPEVRFAEVIDTPVQDVEAIAGHYDGITLSGWFDRNGRAANSRQIYLAVNGRMLRDRQLQQACVVALRPAMMEGQFPRLYLNVEISPQEIDVNVHPTKSEVRFQRSRDVFGLIHATLGRIAKEPTKAYYELAPQKQEPTPQFQHQLFTPSESTTLFRTKSLSEQGPPLNLAHSIAAMEPRALDAIQATETSQTTSLQQATERPTPTDMPSRAPNTQSTASVALAKPKRFSHLQYVGQIKNTYLIFQESDGMVLIDQHAAHERINYEAIKTRFLEQGLKAQPLLLSITYKCKPEDAALALDQQDLFLKLGFEIESFGDGQIIIRSAPEGLDTDRILETFAALVESLRNGDGDLSTIVEDPSRLSPRLERILSTAACHSSIRAGQPLAPREAIALVDQMEETPASLNCPHGRPASIKLSFSQIESLFKRS